MKPRPWTLVAAAALLAIAAPLAAYSVQPMIYAMTPSGTGSSVRLTVSNPREALLNVELQPYRVTADDQGKRSFVPAADDFLLFPPQASIASDKSQIFQVRYVGEPRFDEGRVYVVRVRQTNTINTIRTDPGAAAQTELKLALNFNTTAIVQPKTMAADIAVERDLAPDAKGVLHGRITNRGPGVADLTRLGWAIERSGRREDLDVGDINYGDAIFLEPGHAREITLAPKIAGTGRLIVAPPASRDGRGG